MSVPASPNAAARRERVRAMFDAITPRYDLLNAVLSFGLDRLWRRRVVALAGLEPGGAAVDICTGTGDLAAALARRVGESGQVVGVDFCAAMLERARLKFPRLHFVEGDALALPLEAARFDAATMAFGLRNLVDTQTGFDEMRRVLRPGGRALVLELTRPEGPLRWLYHVYLHVLLPLVGGLVSGNFGAYRYLANTIQAFLAPQGVCEQMRAAGFGEVRMHPLCGGIATIFVGVRQART